MNLPKALKILGLDPEKDPGTQLADFKSAREQIAAMVRNAPNARLAARYQQGLIEFDQALAAVQEHLQAKGLAAPPLPSTRPDPAASKTPVAEFDESGEFAQSPQSRGLSYFAWSIVFLTGAVGGGWIFVKNEQAKDERRLIRIAFLERQGSIMVENRRWQDAAKSFSEIEQLSPGSELAQRGRRSIEAGMIEEHTQFLGYWTGQALAELEAGRLDEAEAAARQVLDQFPNEAEASAILARVATARIRQARAAALDQAREALRQRNWAIAISDVQKILTNTPDDADAQSILSDATTALEKASANRTKAAELLQLAISLDQGQFNQQALDLLREAKSLAPEDQEITSRLEKLSSYTRTLRVPEDYPTPAEALAGARQNDRILIGSGIWKGPLIINVDVDLQGKGFNETRIECPPEQGSAITIGSDARAVRITGITFRHESFATGSDRYSAALVRGGRATFVDCNFTEASGHGLAIIEGGHATVNRCRFTNNGWNGIAAIGHESVMTVSDSESSGNFENGIETWDGATATITNNMCEGNSRNGIHIDNQRASATIEGNQLIANREFGLVLDSAGSGRVRGNNARANLLGGFVIRLDASSLAVTENQATLNEGPGLVLEKGLVPNAYANNTSSKNNGQQVLDAVELAPSNEPPPPLPVSPSSKR